MSHIDKFSRLVVVFDRIKNLAQEDETFCDDLFTTLDDFLDAMSDYGVFGTECQNDPRGDQRDSSWTMNRVQGVDD